MLPMPDRPMPMSAELVLALAPLMACVRPPGLLPRPRPSENPKTFHFPARNQQRFDFLSLEPDPFQDDDA